MGWGPDHPPASLGGPRRQGSECRPPLDYVAEIERLEARRDVNLRRIALAERVVYVLLGAVALAPAFAALFIWAAR
jgi:hypothetical protein